LNSEKEPTLNGMIPRLRKHLAAGDSWARLPTASKPSSFISPFRFQAYVDWLHAQDNKRMVRRNNEYPSFLLQDKDI